MDLTLAQLGPSLPFLGVGIFAYFLRVIQSRKKMTFVTASLDALAAVCSGICIGSIIEIYPFPLASKLALSGLASFIGPDLLGGILAICSAFRNSPDQFILKYIYAFKGVKTGMDIPTPVPAPALETTSPKETV